MRRRAAAAMFLVALASAGFLAWWFLLRRPAPVGPVVAVAPGAGNIDVVVCYPPRAGSDAVEETRSRPAPASPQDRLVQVVAELHRPPASPAALPVFPPGIVPRAVFLADDGVAYIDEPAAALDRPLGLCDEVALVRAVLRAIAINCPEVRAVVFLVDGGSRARLCEHLPAHGRYLIPKLVQAPEPQPGP